MLVLSRQRNEEITIDFKVISDNIFKLLRSGKTLNEVEEIVHGWNQTVGITVVDIRGDKVRLGFEADKSIPIHRQEVYDAIQLENARKQKVSQT